MKILKKFFFAVTAFLLVFQALACGRSLPDAGASSEIGGISEDPVATTVPVTEPQEPPTVANLKLPEDNKKRSDEFALRFLSICGGYSTS